MLGAGGLVLLAGAVAIIFRPAFGAYLFLALNPLVVGIARGEVNSVMRVNELLLLLLVGMLATRAVILMLGGRYRAPPIDRIDMSLLFLVVTGSLVPPLWRWLRGLPLSEDDILYSAVLLKYYVLFRVFRGAVLTVDQVANCLRVSMASASVVALVALFQVNNLFGVPGFLTKHYDQPFEGHAGALVDRATSTVASAFGVGDLMIMNLLIAVGLISTARSGRGLLLGAAGLFLAGCIAAGEFSGYIGLAVAFVVFGGLTGRLHRVLPVGIMATALPVVLLWPVIERRLEGFQGESGVPHSWSGRWENLDRFFLPDLMSGANWLLGVRPAPRVAAPEAWRQWVYIESGYVWLLWIGGIPLLAAFAFFVFSALALLRRITKARRDAVGVAAAASYSFLVVLLVLMLLDPHLTVRGAADFFFPLLAMSLVGSNAAVARVRIVADPRQTAGRAALGSGAVAAQSLNWRETEVSCGR
jgi:hypothetical protein